jgi:hypothetical protein
MSEYEWSEYEQSRAELLARRLIRRRLFGGDYRVTLKGNRYLREAILRNDELRDEMSRQIDRWEAGEMTKAERRQSLFTLVMLGWTRDRVEMESALEDLRSQGFDPLAHLPPDHPLQSLDDTDSDEPPA